MIYDHFANACVKHCQLEKNMAMLLLNNFVQVKSSCIDTSNNQLWLVLNVNSISENHGFFY